MRVNYTREKGGRWKHAVIVQESVAEELVNGKNEKKNYKSSNREEMSVDGWVDGAREGARAYRSMTSVDTPSMSMTACRAEITSW